MGRTKNFFYESFWGIAVVAVVLLAPSSGLITLAVPDEPYGSAVGIPDTTHVSKRASDDSEHFIFDTSFTSYDIHPQLVAYGEVALVRINTLRTIVALAGHIRAPPVV